MDDNVCQALVRAEKGSLSDKIMNLTLFIGDSKKFSGLPVLEQVRLREQLAVMSRYRDILAERIQNFA